MDKVSKFWMAWLGLFAVMLFELWHASAVDAAAVFIASAMGVILERYRK